MPDYTPLRISRQELSYHRKGYLERCQLQGRKCVVKEPIKRILPSTTTTDYYEYGDSIDVYMMLVEDPSKNLLEKFGYEKESKDSKPLIANFPRYRVVPKSVPYDDTPKDEEVDPEFTFRLGKLTTVDSQSDGYPRDDLVDFRVSEGCIVDILMYNGNKDTDYMMQSFTVEKVLAKEDSVFDTANLVPYRKLSEGTTEENAGDSGSRFIMQDDD